MPEANIVSKTQRIIVDPLTMAIVVTPAGPMGPAGPSAPVGDATITSAKILNQAVTRPKIANRAVVASQIELDTITSAEIAPNAITASELADNSVDSAAIVDGAVGTAEIANGAVTTAKLAAGVTASDPSRVSKGGDTMTGNLTIKDSVLVNGANPGMHIVANTAPLNEKIWILWAEAGGGTLLLSAYSDDYTQTHPAMVVYRDGFDVTSLMLGGDVALQGELNVLNKLKSSNIREGVGSPENVVSAPVGTKYIDTAATTGAIEWVKCPGSEAGGWRVVYGDTWWRSLNGIMNMGNVVRDGVGSYMNIRRTGNVVELTGDIWTVPTPSGFSITSPLPSGFRSSGNYEQFPIFKAFVEGASYTGRINPNDKRVEFATGNTPASDSYLRFSHTYITDDPWPTVLP